jgi:membrane associated rhomboid family serine protease
MTPTELPRAPATRGLILATLAAFIATLAAPAAWIDRIDFGLGLVPAVLTGAATVNAMIPAPLTLVTSLFLHGGFLHLAMNMAFLWVVGRPVEWLLGPWRLMLIYFVSGIGGGLAQVASDPASPIPVIGASGAVSGLFGTYLVFFGKPRRRGGRIFGFELDAHQMRLLGFVGVWLLIQGLTGLVFNTPGGGGIAIWAHVGGFLAGLLLAAPLARAASRRG